MSKEKKQQKLLKKQAEAAALAASPKVKMKFSRSMFYNDPQVPLYEANTVYEIEPNMVDRWLKRGGVVVTDEEVVQAPVKAEEPVVPDEEVSEDEDESND